MSDDKTDKESSDDNLRKRGGPAKTKSQINAEYFQALEQWLNDVRTYTYSCSLLAGLPYTMMSQQIYGSPPTQQPSANNFVPPAPPLNQGFGVFNFTRQQQATQPEEGIYCQHQKMIFNHFRRKSCPLSTKQSSIHQYFTTFRCGIQNTATLETICGRICGLHAVVCPEAGNNLYCCRLF